MRLFGRNEFANAEPDRAARSMNEDMEALEDCGGDGSSPRASQPILARVYSMLGELETERTDPTRTNANFQRASEICAAKDTSCSAASLKRLQPHRNPKPEQQSR